MKHSLPDLRTFVAVLKQEGELAEIDIPVDPYLEIAEIHRRVVERQGPALLFTNVRGSDFPVVTNLFGSPKRLEIAFGKRPQQFVAGMVEAVERLMPPNMHTLWAMRGLVPQALKIGLQKTKTAPVLECCQSPPRLGSLPLLTSWKTDGGAFVTLPLVYTEHPEGHGHNLGMYRIHRYDDATTGIHWQIHKGGGYHYHEAEKRNQPLPVTLFIGGPPALMLAAIAPLPEDIPELMLASLLLGKKLPVANDPLGGHRLVAACEFAVKGKVPPHERRDEGPFGDHYGYDSLAHPYPVFHVDRIYHRKKAIYPATVVGRPRQEDYYIGDFLQELLSPLFPLVMKGVKQLKTFGDTGFHCLATARVENRYPREAFVAGLRILGEGQLSLTKFLIVTDGPVDIENFADLWPHVLQRIDFAKDLFVFSNVSQDTLDYTGPSVNNGSKAMLLGLGEKPVRTLPVEFTGTLPEKCSHPVAFLPGTLVVQGVSYDEAPPLAADLAACPGITAWPVVLLVDDSNAATCSMKEFLWTWFTRFEPAADIHAAAHKTVRFHTGLTPPVVFDCRMKPWYTPVLEVDADTKLRVDGMMGAVWKRIGL